MLGLQGSNSSPKVYRCVACLATFNGLASLLVHQATHASSLPKAPAAAPSDFSLRQTRFVSMDSPSEHPNPQLDCSSPSFYICDCGEEFQDFSLMLEHKRSHQPQPQLLQPLDNNSNSVLSSGTGCDGVFPSQHASFMPTVSQPGLVLSCPSTSRFPAVELPTLSDRQADRSLGDGVAMVTSPQGQCTPSPDENQLENMSASAEQMAEAAEDMRFQDNAKSIPGSNKDDSLPRNQSVMKLLASAYMKRFQKPLAQNQNDNTVTPKKEVDPVDITPALKNEAAPINDLSIAQLRRLLAKPGIKTKAPSISRILECSKKKVVSLTKTFSPVVVLETRQKLMAPGSNGTFRYQCGRCRRGFQNLDKLTEHHFLHKKERIKCCRRCKQLIIGRLPLPDSHVCPQLRKSTQTSALRKKTTLGQKLVPFHSLSNSKKVFFCPLCKHSYARRWNLKMHRCQGPRSTPSPQASPSIQPAPELRSNSAASTDAVVTAGSQVNKSVAVGTDITSKVKVEVTSQQSTVSQSAWTPAKSFLPYYSKSAMMEEHTDVSLSGILVQQGEESNSWDAAGDTGDSDEGEWTMPLDDEIEMVSAQREAGNDTGVKSSVPQTMPYFIRDGAKRYPCSRCQKTYSRPSTLRRHLRLCGLRQRGPSGPARALLTTNNKPLFACLVCGKTFNRKDNMMVHRRKCQMQRTMTDGAQVDTGAVQHSMSSNGAESQPDGDDGSNWGIMSLPSVLPRRVTCECGVGFTSPRLLLEHLQKHAQESYTCPTCGETVSSWADYEVHLQIHMLPHHQLLKGLPHRSQPLLLRFQQQPPQQQQHQQWQQQQWQQQQQQQRQQQQQQQRQQQQQQQRQQQQQQQQQSSPSVHQSPQRQTRAGLVPNPAKQPKILCSRCGNAFSTRHSLRRHLSWNRCKGARATNPANPPKTYHCSHCNSDFPNTISLMFHQRSGACKPAIKPVRCPVCLRWFGTLDGLQKHLLTHKQSNSESHRCDICQGTYPNLKSLKSHRRRIHRIMAGDVNEQLTS